MIQEALCWSYLKHTNGCPHHFLLACSRSMELITPVPRDRATSASEQRPKCFPLNFQSIFRAHFNKEGGGGGRGESNNTEKKHAREKGKGEKRKKKMHDHTRTKAVVLGTSMVVQQARAWTWAATALFSLFPLPLVLSLLLSLADKDTANLFRRQGHGWSRQTLLRSVPPGRPSPHYFVFPESIVARNVRSGARRPSAALWNLIPVTHLLRYNTLAPHRVTILLLRSPPPGSWLSFPPPSVFFRQIIMEEMRIGEQWRPNLGGWKHIPGWLRRGVMHVIFSSIISPHIQIKCWVPAGHVP